VQKFLKNNFQNENKESLRLDQTTKGK